MIIRLHHIGIAVGDLAQALVLFRDALGLQLVQEIDRPGLRAALLPIGGIVLELIQPDEHPQNRPGEVLADLVRERGGGVHHLAFEVDDIEREVSLLSRRGIFTLDDAPVPQAGRKIAWLKEDSMAGAMIEICVKGYRIA